MTEHMTALQKAHLKRREMAEQGIQIERLDPVQKGDSEAEDGAELDAS